MGCSISRSCDTVVTGSSRESHGGASTYSATPARSLPSHLVHHPPLKKGDTYHLVSLTSTTYGSLFLTDHKSHEPLPIPAKAIEKEEEEDYSNASPESVINTWELMDGLEDDSDSSNYTDLSNNADHVNSNSNSNSNSDSGSADFSKKAEHTNEAVPSSKDDKIVLYFTSLRGIRKTFEDCCFVRMTLRGFRVAIDERDISMDSSYRKELERALGGAEMENYQAAALLPQVFIRGKRIGGAEKMKQLNEAGELGKLLEGFPVRDYRVACRNCGDARFVMCRNCSGSRKVFDKKESRLRRCLVCNENGLTKCHLCC